MSAESAVHEVNDQTFAAEVLEASTSVPVVVDFWAPWCEPCRTLGPIIEKVAAEHGGEVRLVKLNTDENPQTASMYGIQSIPAVKAFRDGKVLSEFMGSVPEPQVRSFFERLLPTEAERVAADGLALLESDPDAAEARFRQALSDGMSVDAVVGLSALLIERGDMEEASRIMERAPNDLRVKVMKHQMFLDEFASHNEEAELRKDVAAEPTSPNARYRLGVILAAEGLHQEALDELLESVRLDRKFEEGAARKAALVVFDLLGPDSELTREYQRKLSMILF